jgi:16S rRNA (adenine1518-N6/adenine1519-N6)-dimethyltransferase
MDLTNPQDLRAAMKLAGIKPNKNLGQHFLADRESVEAVIDAAEVTAADTVLEIGPGLGVMTQPLCSRAGRVVAVEMDHALADLLRRGAPPNLDVVERDFIKFDLGSLPAGYKVAANIPYYLTSRIFRLLLESATPPSVISLLVQKEVAERVAARPGAMSVLAVSVQYYGRPELTRVVGRELFVPPPRVDSAILRVRVTGPAFPADPARLFRLVKAGFGERRKQLKNSLAGGLGCDSATVLELLAAADLPLTARAQELSIDGWRRLYDAATARGLI